jgi:hypothetical protein
MKRSSLIWIAGLCAIACGSRTTLSPAAARIIEGNDSALTDCTFLQKVKSTASESGSAAETRAKNDAREQAAAIGATHMRWIVPCCTYVEADAYRCDAPD